MLSYNFVKGYILSLTVCANKVTSTENTFQYFQGDKKNLVRDICLKYFEKELQLVNPSIVVAVGTYVDDCFKNLSKQYKDIRFLKLAHPSPRSLNNTNWPEKAEIFFKENDLMKYLRNEI